MKHITATAAATTATNQTKKSNIKPSYFLYTTRLCIIGKRVLHIIAQSTICRVMIYSSILLSTSSVFPYTARLYIMAKRGITYNCIVTICQVMIDISILLFVSSVIIIIIICLYVCFVFSDQLLFQLLCVLQQEWSDLF